MQSREESLPHPPREEVFRKALNFHQRGLIRDARELYLDVLKQNPAHADGHHLLGLTYVQCGEAETGIEHIRKATALNPDFAEAHYNLGNALLTLKRPEQALASFDAALRLNPQDAQCHLERGNALKELGRLPEAIDSFQTAVRLAGRYAEAHNNLGIALKETGRIAEALQSYDAAIRLQPAYAEAHSNRGNALRDAGRVDEALASHDKAISLNPDYAEAHCNRGIVLTELKRCEEALASIEQSIRLKPGHAEAWNARGSALKGLHRFEEAMESYDKAIHLKPDYAEAYNNRGILLSDLERPEEALSNYDKAIALKPGYAEALGNKAYLLLHSGHFQEGFALYRWRWNTKGMAQKPPFASLPAWDGKPVSGKLLLWAEQGLGDEVLYASLLSLVSLPVADIALTADKRLHPLYRRAFPGLELLDSSSPLDALAEGFTAQAAIGDLGDILRVDVTRLAQRRHPFLTPDQERTREIKVAIPVARDEVLCGLSWRSANKRFGAEKSIRLHDLASLLATPGLSFVNLQYGEVAQEIDDAEQHMGVRVHQVSGLDVFNDIDGLLSLIDACDVVLTTCNVTAHLAGAMGKRAAVLVPTARGRIWYWQGEGNWYPSLTLFSQQTQRDWEKPIQMATSWIRDRKWQSA